MTTDVCEVCGGGMSHGGKGKVLECQNYDDMSYTPCANAEQLAITRAAEIARLQAVNAELVKAARIGEKFLIRELECYPIGHKGSCGPWNQCDGNCAASAYISQDLHKVQKAIANATKEPR
jgi:hypothetical protein